MQALILAGGKGTRLMPYTANLPKPLMPIDNMPILEVIVKQLKFQNFESLTFRNHKKKKRNRLKNLNRKSNFYS